MLLETLKGVLIYSDSQRIQQMTRDELQDYLELRGYAVYDDEPTNLLRETALEDFESELQCQG